MFWQTSNQKEKTIRPQDEEALNLWEQRAILRGLDQLLETVLVHGANSPVPFNCFSELLNSIKSSRTLAEAVFRAEPHPTIDETLAQGEVDSTSGIS